MNILKPTWNGIKESKNILTKIFDIADKYGIFVAAVFEYKIQSPEYSYGAVLDFPKNITYKRVSDAKHAFTDYKVFFINGASISAVSLSINSVNEFNVLYYFSGLIFDKDINIYIKNKTWRRGEKFYNFIRKNNYEHF